MPQNHNTEGQKPPGSLEETLPPQAVTPASSAAQGLAENPTVRLQQEGGATATDMPPTVAGGTESPSGGVRATAPSFGDYEILSEIARGGMGVVYRARQKRLNRTVALKMILAGNLASATDIKRFYTEAEAAAALEHSGIVPIYEIGEQGGQHFFSMAYIDGQSLHSRLKEGPLLPREAAEILRSIAEAVQYAHDKGIVHRDLKPHNILLDGEGKPKVTDFGLAKRLDSQEGLTGTGDVLGTPSYMAPEQSRGDHSAIGPLTDVYALGAILYATLTGRPPFQAATLPETLRQVSEQEPVSPKLLNTDTPQDLETICLKCLQKEPAKRYADVAILAEDLRRFLNGEPIAARPVGQTERLARWCRRNPLVAAMASGIAATLLVALAGISLGFMQANRARRDADKQRRIAEVARDDAELETKRTKAAEQRASQLLESAERERRKANLSTARLAAERGTELCEKGRVDQGLLWLARAADQDEHDRPDFSQFCRRTFELWSETIHELIVMADHPHAIRALQASNGVEGFIAGTARGEILAIDANGGMKTLCTLPVRDVQKLAINSVQRMAATIDANGGFGLWDISTGQSLPVDPISPSPYSSLAFSRDGQLLALGCKESHARIWNIATSAWHTSELEHDGNVHSMDFSHDGSLLVTGTWTRKVTVWDTTTGAKQAETLAARGADSVAFNTTTSTIAVGGFYAGECFSWPDLKPLPRNFVHEPTRVGTLAWSSQHSVLCSGADDRTARLWLPNIAHPWGQILQHRYPLQAIEFSADGSLLATAGGGNGGEGGEVRIWRVNRKRGELPLVTHGKPITGAAFSPNGLYVALVDETGLAFVTDVATGKHVSGMLHDPRLTYTGNEDRRYALAWSQDSSRLAVGSFTGAICVWDWQDNALVTSPLSHPGEVWALKFAPEPETLVSGGGPRAGKGTVRFWNSTTGESRRVIEFEGRVHDIEFLSSRQLLLIAGEYNRIRICRYLNANNEYSEVEAPNAVYSLAAIMGDQQFVAGYYNATIDFWNSSNRRTNQLSQAGPVTQLDSQDHGKQLLSFDHRSARVWDASLAKTVGPELGGADLRAVAVSPDGQMAVLAYRSGEVKLRAMQLPSNKSPSHFLAWASRATGLFLTEDDAVDLIDQQRHANDVARELRGSTLQAQRSPSAQLVERAERALALSKRFLALLRGEDKPADNAERLTFAKLAYDQKKFSFATRLWAEALTNDPGLGDSLQTQHPYNAACAAVLAAAGQDQGEPPPDDAAKAILRSQALDWLKAELAALDKLPESDWPQARPWDWHKDSNLASVREAAELGRLPEAEQGQWQTLWAEVAAFSSSGEHFNRGLALSGQGKLDEAIAEYRAAIRRKPDFAEAYCNLGRILPRQAGYAEGLAMLRKGHELGFQKPDWHFPSAQWVQQAEQTLALSKRFLAVLRGDDKPADNAERLDFAQMAYDQKRFSFATRLWAEALTTDPKLGDSRQTQHPYNAACAAVLAAAGHDQGELPPDDAAKAMLRSQALNWLKAELTAWDRFLEPNPLQTQAYFVQNLSHWQQDTDLATIRDAADLARLPDAERTEWQSLWTEVAAAPMNAKSLVREAEKKNWVQAVADYSKLITPETTDATLLVKRATACLATENWNLARADWLRVVELQPDQIPRAFEEFKKAERWNEAAEFGLRLVQDKPNDTMVWLRIAPVLAMSDDQAGYSKFCGRMAHQFAESQLPGDAERVVKASLLRAHSIDLDKLPSDKLAKLLDAGMVPDGFQPWGWCARALLAYREGDAMSAVRYATKSEEHKPAEVTRALNLAILAMAQHQLQHPKEAHRLLDEASQLIDRLQADEAIKGYHDLLIAQILFREADTLINGTKQKAGGDKAAPLSPPQTEK